MSDSPELPNEIIIVPFEVTCSLINVIGEEGVYTVTQIDFEGPIMEGPPNVTATARIALSKDSLDEFIDQLQDMRRMYGSGPEGDSG